jgi:hypothetical protein
MTPTRLLVALAATVLTIGAPRLAHAQAAQKKKATPRKVLRLEEMKVEGRIQKPQAMFLMPRANLNYGDLDRAESFLPKIVQATEKDPF